MRRDAHDDLLMTPHPIIVQIIDRDCHVRWSNRRVIRHVISRLKNKYATFAAMPRDDQPPVMGRRTMMRQCIAVHRENRELYQDVMGGRFK